jgi:hypothetical protein
MDEYCLKHDAHESVVSASIEVFNVLSKTWLSISSKIQSVFE